MTQAVQTSLVRNAIGLPSISTATFPEQTQAPIFQRTTPFSTQAGSGGLQRQAFGHFSLNLLIFFFHGPVSLNSFHPRYLSLVFPLYPIYYPISALRILESKFFKDRGWAGIHAWWDIPGIQALGQWR